MEQVMLDMIPTGAKAVCHVSQYDIGRTIRFNLRSGGAAYTLSGTETVKVYIKKPDGTTTERNIANTSSTYVDWVTGEGDCDQAGNCECELVITSGTTVIGSKNFTVKIEEDPYNDQGIVTETAGPAVIATFTTNIVDLLQEVKCEINATGGNGTPDNPIPIVGYSEANITRCGVNFLPTFEPQTISASGLTAVVGNDGVITLNNTSTSNGSLVLAEDANGLFTMPSGLYVHLTNDFITSQAAFTFDFKDGTANGPSFNALNRIWVVPSANVGKVVTRIRIYFTSGLTLTNAKCRPMLALSSTAIPYAPYNGTTVTIAFGQTVYGGVLDVTRGKLTVTHGFYNGTWGDGGAEYAPDIMPDIKRRTFMVSPIAGNLVANNGKAKCNITDVFSTANNLNSPHFYVYDNLYLYAPRTLDDSTPVQCSYVLATPFDIDLTPVQIEALLGVNNVWHDGNGNTEVKYLYNA